MGRRIPSTVISSINPALSLSLLAGWIAVTMAILATLCAARSRKSSPPSPSTSSTCKSQRAATEPKKSTAAEAGATAMSSPPTSTTITLNNFTEETSPRIQEQLHLSSPMTLKAKESPSRHSKAKQKLSSTLSMKLTGSSLSKIRTRKESQQKQEDSLWTKTIILGEKCKVPNEEDAIIYDRNGNRIAAYPSKTPRSLPVSRTNSLLDQESLPFK